MGVLEGDLDAEGTKILLEALDHCAPPDATGGPVPPRSLAQRRADALVDICGAYLSGNAEGTAPVNLNVTMDHGTLTGSPPADPRQVRCELEGFGPIPLATAFRLACDCSVTRVLMRGESEVLDLGRSTRLASAAQHKALAIRDRGCVFPGCDRPPAWCNAHHLVWWEHGGLTDDTEPLPVVSAPPHPLSRRRLGPHPQRRRHLPSPRTTPRPRPDPTTRTRTTRGRREMWIHGRAAVTRPSPPPSWLVRLAAFDEGGELVHRHAPAQLVVGGRHAGRQVLVPTGDGRCRRRRHRRAR